MGPEGDEASLQRGQAFESPRAFAMSKFFAGGDSSTESSESESSSSGSGSESESEDEKPQQKIKQQKEQPKERAGPRKVVSKNVKTHQDFKQTIKQLKNAMAINDWNVVTEEFASINKQLAKAQAMVAEEGVPAYYIACMVKLAEVADKEKVKKFSKTNAKSLNAMKQNIKKNNANYETEIAKYLANPEAADEEGS